MVKEDYILMWFTGPIKDKDQLKEEVRKAKEFCKTHKKPFPDIIHVNPSERHGVKRVGGTLIASDRIVITGHIALYSVQ